MFLCCQTRKFSHAKITAFTVIYTSADRPHSSYWHAPLFMFDWQATKLPNSCYEEYIVQCVVCAKPCLSIRKSPISKHNLQKRVWETLVQTRSFHCLNTFNVTSIVWSPICYENHFIFWMRVQLCLLSKWESPELQTQFAKRVWQTLVQTRSFHCLNTFNVISIPVWSPICYENHFIFWMRVQLCLLSKWESPELQTQFAKRVWQTLVQTRSFHCLNTFNVTSIVWSPICYENHFIFWMRVQLCLLSKWESPELQTQFAKRVWQTLVQTRSFHCLNTFNVTSIVWSPICYENHFIFWMRAQLCLLSKWGGSINLGGRPRKRGENPYLWWGQKIK